MSDCIFCKIIRGELPATKEYEDDEFIVIRDINPSAPVHLLVIPRKHIETLMDVSEPDLALIGRVYGVVQNVAREKGIHENGFRVLHNVNEWGGQKVFHIHFHILGGKKFA